MNFDTHTPMRLSQFLDVDVGIIVNGVVAVGIGESAVTAVAPAIANANFNAAGPVFDRCRLRRRMSKPR
jgi:isoquinoline 1-oxidoreductase subunit beta